MIVNILGTEYTVKITKMSKADFGECDTEKKVIKLNEKKEEKAETLVHEVIHGALFESGLTNILHHTEGLEESIVRAIEHGLRTAELIPELPIEPERPENEQTD